MLTNRAVLAFCRAARDVLVQPGVARTSRDVKALNAALAEIERSVETEEAIIGAAEHEAKLFKPGKAPSPALV